MHWFYYLGRFVIRVIVFLFTSTKVTGKNNLPDKGAILVVSNHLSLADPPIIGACLKRRAVFMAKEELFRNWLSRWIMRGFGAFPVHRGSVDRKAIRNAEEALSNGFLMAMFPEAKRSTDACLGDAHDGASLIASRCNVPLLPIGIYGTEEMKGCKWLIKRPRVIVNIGVPFYLPRGEGKLTRQTW